MLVTHVYMGWKFQRTLKLDISYSLEHFFIPVAIFTQVASAQLNQTLDRSCDKGKVWIWQTRIKAHWKLKIKAHKNSLLLFNHK